MKKIVVGLSGGLDSTMALLLLKKAGWQPVGLFLKLAIWEDENNLIKENISSRSESLALAEKICKKLKIPFYILDLSEEFREKVIGYFISELKANYTPNPCIFCNSQFKFKALFQWAQQNGIKYVATGHYARTGKNPQTSAFQLLAARDKTKDQSYSLSFLPYEWLSSLIFPLGDYQRTELITLAKKYHLAPYLKRKSSQDLCFVGRKARKIFLQKVLGENPGPIKELSGKIVGEHKGLHFYTIGQRKELRLSGGPYFVIGKSLGDNTLWISKKEKDLFQQEIQLGKCNFLTPEPLKEKITVKARLRYRQPLTKAVLYREKENWRLLFDKPQRAPTPGQFAVFYQEDICLGGGKIISSF